ncbi:MAG: mechanosensitive ion channel domain-containing protein [Bacteroidota bacterium]
MMELYEAIVGWVNRYLIQLLLTVGVYVLFSLIKSITKRVIIRHSRLKNVHLPREQYVRKLARVALTLLMIIIIGIIWEISLTGLSLYFTSIFTIIGVGLVAIWSMLSNMTASILIFFFFPFRMGAKVKIMDGDNSVTGIIKDIGLFTTIIELSGKSKVSYPNNLLIQKPVEVLRSSDS